jgi:RNA-directed DNA polymerase
LMIDYRFEFEDWLNAEFAKQRSQKPYLKKFIGARGYPHFDTTINLFSAEQVGSLRKSFSSSSAIKQWKFLPFIRKDQRNRRYRHKIIPSPVEHRDQKKFTHIKSRPIMYASHHDACLFALLNSILAKPYEQEIANRALSENVIAYRSIKGANNITFAKKAFDFMESHGNFACLLIDIKGFFDNVLHKDLNIAIEKVLGQKIDSTLKFILSNITNYRYVIEDEVIKELRRAKRPYYVPLGKKSRRLCSIDDFNGLINNRQFIRRNSKGIGFPQGSPVSGLLANIFLLDFDSWMADKLSSYKLGFYQRYSDDMIIICPPDKVKELYVEIKYQLSVLGLSLSTSKSELFLGLDGAIENRLSYLEATKPGKRQNVQYLGLEWNGQQIVLRPSTIEKRFRPRDKLAQKYWQYHLHAIKKVGQKGIKRQYSRIRRSVKSKT